MDTISSYYKLTIPCYNKLTIPTEGVVLISPRGMIRRIVVTRTAIINANGVKLCRVRKETQQRTNVVTQMARIIKDPVPAANVRLIIIQN